MKKNLLRFITTITLGSFLSSASLQAQTLISQFDFNGNMNDAIGNSTCTGFNNTISAFASGEFQWVGDSNYYGGGLKIRIPDAVFTENDYSVAINFQFSEINSYRKILDFANMGSDQGLYYNGSMRLYSAGQYGSTMVNPGTFYTILLTRSGADDSTKAYIVNGNTLSLESEADDTGLDFVSVLSGADRVLRFFHDDSTTASEFSVSGSVSQIRIWNGVVSISDLVSVPDAQQAASFSLFPNPANTELNIQFANAQNGAMNIFDAFGKLVFSENLQNENSKQLNVEGLPSGIYFIRVNDLSMRFIKE